jgi:hypothetical protein
MSRLVAVLPAHIRRRWDAIAFRQLEQRTLELEEQSMELERRARLAESCADMWQQIAEHEREGHTIGLTPEGRVVVLESQYE